MNQIRIPGNTSRNHSSQSSQRATSAQPTSSGRRRGTERTP